MSLKEFGFYMGASATGLLAVLVLFMVFSDAWGIKDLRKELRG